MPVFDANPFPKLPVLTFRPRVDPKASPDTADGIGLGKALGSYAQTGLQGALHVLDTPGSIVRGGIGKLTGAKPLEGERTSGRDITNSLGLTSKHSKSWLSSGLGLAVDIATDPLTYLTAGTHHALTGAGKAVAKTGGIRGLSRKAMIEGFHGLESTHLDRAVKGGMTPAEALSDLAHERAKGFRIATPEHEAAVLKATGRPLEAHEPLGALAGIGLPFKSPSLLLGTGSGAGRIAGTLDKLGDTLKFGNPLGRAANALFDTRVNEATGAATQRAFSTYGHPVLEAAKAGGRDESFRVVQGIDAGIKAGLPEQQLLRAARQHGEGVGLRGASPEVAAAAGPIGEVARRSSDARLAEAVRLGLPLSDLSDPFARHVPRRGVDLESAKAVAAGKLPGRIGIAGPTGGGNLPLTTAASKSRDSAYRGVPGGSAMLDDMAIRHAGDPLGIGVHGIRRDILRSMAGEVQAGGGTLDRAMVRQLGAKSDALARKLRALPVDHSGHGIGVFSTDLAGDLARAAEGHAKATANAAAIYGFLGDNARPASALGPDAVPVSALLKRIGLRTTPADSAAGTPIQGALVQTLKSLARQGAGPVDRHLLGSTKRLRRAVDQFAVTPSHAAELLASHARWSMPEVAKGPAGLFDSTTSLFKSLAYPIWPASHVRNAIGAGVNNLTSGTGLADHALQFKLMRGTATAAELRKAIPSIPAGASDEVARGLARQEQYAHGMYSGSTGSTDLDNTAARLQSTIPGRLTPVVPGSDRTAGGSFMRDTADLLGTGARGQAKAIGDKIRHPLSAPSPIEVAGAFGGVKDFPALETGRKVGESIEDFMRGAHYLGKRQAGFDAATAGRATKDLHFAYDDVTRFEKNVMRRAIPFYTFSRKNLPMQAARLANTPGSTLAQLRLMSGAGGDPENPLPGSLAGGLTIPAGKGPDGRARFVSGFGLPLEEALGRIPFKGGLPDARGAALSVASGLNPLIKAPIEAATDLDFFTGRKLSDLQPSAAASGIGKLFGDDNPQALSHWLGNTPAARFLSAGDRLASEKQGALAKLMALASGVKITDVDLEKARRGEEGQARSEMMASMPHLRGFKNYSIRPGEEDNLTPAEVEMLRSAKEARQEAARAAPRRIGFMARRTGE